MVVVALRVHPFARRQQGGGAGRREPGPFRAERSRRPPERARPAVPAVRVRVTVLVVALEAVVGAAVLLLLAHQGAGMFTLEVVGHAFVRRAVALGRRDFDLHLELVFDRLSASVRLGAVAGAGDGQAELQRAFVPLVAVVASLLP